MRNNLYTLLKADEKQVRKIIVKALKENGYKPIVTDDFIYAAGTVPVMLMSHYDTYAESPRYIKNTNGLLTGLVGNKPHQLGADDRAGIYAILETIPKHHCHVLFTGGEERGGKGAHAFVESEIKPDVNYCLQFDRRGRNDAVYYDGDNPDFEEFITSHGWETETGSFTDICVVCPHLGVMGVNLSIGYANEHTDKELLDTEVMNANIKRIPELLDGEKFEYIESLRPSWYRGMLYGDYWDYDSYCDKDLCEYYIRFNDKFGNECIDSSFGFSYEEAIGVFLIDHPSLSYDDVITCTEIEYVGRSMYRV